MARIEEDIPPCTTWVIFHAQDFADNDLVSSGEHRNEH